MKKTDVKLIGGLAAVIFVLLLLALATSCQTATAPPAAEHTTTAGEAVLVTCFCGTCPACKDKSGRDTASKLRMERIEEPPPDDGAGVGMVEPPQ